MADRIAHDAYYTPQPVADAIVHRLRHTPRVCWDSVLEPHAGKCAFARALLTRAGSLHLNDLHAHPETAEVERRGAEIGVPVTVRRADFLKLRLADHGVTAFTLVAGNCPYNGAEAHVRKALSIVDPQRGTVAFLLRQSFLESKARAAGLWREHPPAHVWMLDKRPRFAHGGTDSVGYCVVVWQPGMAPGMTGFDWIRW